MGSIVYLIMFVYIIAVILSYVILMIISGMTGSIALFSILIVNAIILIYTYKFLKAFRDKNRNKTS